jgi:hypothetical protein
MSVPTQGISQGGNALKTFQLTTEGIKTKSSKEYGLAISKYISSTATFSTGGYYFNRNARFIKNRNYANGRIDVQAMFQDRFHFNAKQNYIALNWNALQIVNRIVSGLVGRWMQRSEKVEVKAVDDLSQTRKKEEYEKLEFYIDNREKIAQLEAESGIQIIPQGDDLPEDKEALNIWKAELQRLPEEILNEMGCNDVLTSNGWFDVLKEQMLHDAAETLFVGTYTWMDNTGVIHVEWVKPENAIYSSSDYNDLRDTSWRGQAPALKISQIRRQWGKEFNPDNPLALTEKEIWEKVVPQCKEFQYQTNISWNDMWVASFLRPYDEWNVKSIQFEIKTVDSEPYTVTKTKATGKTYVEKGLPTTASGKLRDKPLDNQNIIGDTNWNIYRGVYLPDCDLLIQWGLKDNMIRPQDPKEIGNAEFSYSYVMPQNYLMRNLAIPEKIEAAVDGMILALLKMQQVMARLIPSGWVIDETVLQGVDYGLGNDGNKSVDHVQQFFQTGLLYYNGLDAEGNRVEPPIKELTNAGFAAQMQGLIQNYQFNYQALKDELGEDPNLISAALQPRVTGGNVEASQQMAEYATDYIYRAYAECMKITSRKVSCLLKDSIEYGSKAYRHIAKKEDFDKRIFTTDIRFLPTQFEVQRFEMILNQAIAASPDLLQFLDPFKLMRVAKEDVKLAELLYRQAQKRMIIHTQMVAQQNQEATFKAQIESSKTTEEEKRKTEDNKGQIDLEQKRIEGETANKSAVITMVTGLLGKGMPIPPNLQPLVNATVESLILPMVVQTEQQKQQIMQAMLAQQQQPQDGFHVEQPTQQTDIQQQPMPQQEVAA